MTDELALIERLGGEGLGRRAIAAVLGLSADELAARERGDAAFAAAMARAVEGALNWWEELGRQAMRAGRFNFPSWERELRRRFRTGVGAEGAAAPPAPAKRRVVFNIPCNGRVRPLPNGQCPDCGKFHRHWNEGRYWDHDFDDDGDDPDVTDDDDEEGDDE